MRRAGILGVVAVGLLAAPSAQADINSALGVPCVEQGDGVRQCGSNAPRSTAPAWDGAPIDVNIAFPPEPASGPDGNFPLVMMFHGYGGGKLGFGSMERWLDRGYATFSMTARGFRESCGSAGSRAAGGAACDDVHVRLIDNRFEVRDAQEFAGQLADEGPGLIDPQRIGAIGGSYGGGMSMALGALKNRKVLPDGSLVPWTSPAGKAMQIAATAPNIPWTDLAYSLVPNGSTLDYVADAPYRGPVGVVKQSLVEGLYFSGLSAPGYYAPEGTDPSADLVGWRARLNQGEPYGADTQAIVDEITRNHSSYYIDDSIPPAPMLMSSGFTDDLFPADETIRYYNRTKTQYPDADLALFFGDFGHPRSNNKTDVSAALRERENAWFDHYIKGVGAEPEQGATSYTVTCPAAAPSGGPYSAPSWAASAPGEIRFRYPEDQTIAADSTTGGQFNPISSNACTTAPSDDRPGAATYKLDPAPAGGYTLLGAATVIARYSGASDTSQIAARLLDVAPDGTQKLVNRGLWRPQIGAGGKQVFQLHPNGWTFEEGHVPKLELLAQDAAGAPLGNYGRPSNGQTAITVSNLKLRLPVVERPGSLGGLVGAPAPKVVPDGYELAADFKALPKPKPKVKKRLQVKGKKVLAPVTCTADFVACHDGTLRVTSKSEPKGKGKGERAGKKRYVVAKGSFEEIAGGTTQVVKLKLTGKGRRAVARKPRLTARTELRIAELVNATRGKAKLVREGR